MKKQRLLCRVLAVTVLLSSFLIAGGAANASNKAYLVLIETQKGKWTAYNDMVSLSANGAAMLKALDFCDAAGFDYASSNTTKQFSIGKNGNIYNLYKAGSKAYTYCSAKSKTIKAAKDSSYYDKTFKTNLCEAASVATLCSYKVFQTAGTAYGNLKFTDVLCYSKYSAIKTLPDIKKILYENGKKLYDPEPTYTSPDGKWTTKMFYLDGTINGTKKLWPTKADVTNDDLWKAGKSDRISVTLDPNHYDPYNYTAKNPYVSFEIEAVAKQGVSYSTKDFGYMGFKTEGFKVIDLTTSGAINFCIAPTNGGLAYNWTSYTDKSKYFKEVTLRIDTLDRDKGVVIGYIKVKGNDGSNSIDMEGYFAEKYKDDAARPTDSQIYSMLHPSKTTGTNTAASKSGTGSAGTATGNAGSGSKIGTVKVPTIKYVTCPTCGGTGKIKCVACKGVGYTEYMGYRYGVYGKIIKPCLNCGGAGFHICSRCGGGGTITKLVP